jgi:hypothetical protein
VGPGRPGNCCARDWGLAQPRFGKQFAQLGGACARQVNEEAGQPLAQVELVEDGRVLPDGGTNAAFLGHDPQMFVVGHGREDPAADPERAMP